MARLWGRTSPRAVSDFAKLTRLPLADEDHDFESEHGRKEYFRDAAEAMLRCCRPVDVLKALIKLRHDHAEHADVFAEIAIHCVPVVYDPNLIEPNRKRLEANGFTLIEDNAGNATIAEIISAALHRSSIAMKSGTGQGTGALDLTDLAGPEEGPEVSALSKRARAWMKQMLVELGPIEGTEDTEPIESLGNRLYAELALRKTKSKQDRVCYCLFRLAEDSDKDEQRKVIDRIHRLVNTKDELVLFFVEIKQTPPKEHTSMSVMLRDLTNNWRAGMPRA